MGKKKSILVILILLLVVVVGFLVFNKNSNDGYSNVGADAYANDVLNNEGEYVLEDGSYAVNVHIPAGEYDVAERDDEMTITVLNSDNSEEDYSDIKKGDKLELGDESRIIMISGGTLVLK